jgi:hypothetical protein
VVIAGLAGASVEAMVACVAVAMPALITLPVPAYIKTDAMALAFGGTGVVPSGRFASRPGAMTADVRRGAGRREGATPGPLERRWLYHGRIRQVRRQPGPSTVVLWEFLTVRREYRPKDR